MTQYTTPHTIRVQIDPAGKIHALIVSEPDNTRSFYLVHRDIGEPVFMFGCAVSDDQEAAELAKSNAILYVPDNWVE